MGRRLARQTLLLGKYTQMRVLQAEHGARAQPNHVYVIPPNAVLKLERGLEAMLARFDELWGK